MAETALKFGPEWLRALSHGNSVPAPISPEAPLSRYKLAQYRYGREEMLALFAKDLNVPEVLKPFDYLLADKCQLPISLVPMTEEEQRLWARSVNSDIALRASGKGPAGPGNGMLRGGRGGSVDRGRARGGRGGYYQRGMAYDENEDGPPGGFSRLRTLERSQSASEKDQRWDDRDRRLERPFSGRAGLLEDSNSGHAKQDSLRPPADNWRRNEKDDDNSGWRTTNTRGDKFAGRNFWRVPAERDRMRPEFDGREKGLLGREMVPNGPGKNASHPRQRSTSGHFWDEDMVGDILPEWSVEESATVTDVVGTFDSSGAFMESKDTTLTSDEIYASDEEDCVKKDSPGPKSEPKPKAKPDVKVAERPIVKQPAEPLNVQSSKVLYIEKPSEPQGIVNHVPRTVKQTLSVKSDTCINKELHGKTLVPEIPPPEEEVPGPTEEDTFAHHKKATENMMAQWTEEEEQRVVSESTGKPVLPVHHEDAQKWFYRDPQAEIQGPFTSAEMRDWFKAGYFSMDLLVRRGCDERFMQLGELIQSWGRMPFLPGTCPPPLRVAPVQTVAIAAPVPQAVAVPPPNPPPAPTQPAAQMSQTDAQLRLMQQQLFQQLVQQQLLFRQAHLQQLINQLKQQESFAKLNSQQQVQAVQQLIAQQQQVARTSAGSLAEQPALETVPPVPFPLMGMAMPAIMKNDVSLWNVPPSSGTWPVGQSPPQPPGCSIWDTTESQIPLPMDNSELEKQKKLAAEEEEKRRQAAEAVKKLEEEKRRREEEEKKQKEEAERLLREIQRQQEEEKRRLEEMKRLKEEEEKRRQDELKQLEEIKKEEERRLEEMKRQEERRLEEMRKQEELRKLEEKKRAELEEQRRNELKQMEELRKIEEKKQEELQRKLKEQERLLEMEKQKAQRLKEQQALELKLQKEAERQLENQRRLLAEKQLQQQQQQQQQKEAESSQRPPEPKGPVWGLLSAELQYSELSLSDIQWLQERKEEEEKEKIKRQQYQQQQLLIQQQNLKQVQANKNGLSWAKRSAECSGAVKSLAEIQQEEAERAAQEQQKSQKIAASTVQAPAATGVWGNSSQISRVTAPPAWNVSNNSSFWDDALKSTSPAQKPTKNSDSAFPALSNSAKPANVNSNKNKNVRAKRDEEAVLKIFETQRKTTDEFTAWCTEALSNLPSSLDVPTFVAFLKDVDSPYEVFDYVRSYLGDGKEAREFGKQFLERRSKFRNQAKQASTEENMWGPAPAITPAVKPAAVNDSDVTCTKGKAKKKKNRMQKLDNSMLGFTVQPNPDRINVGEIDRVEGM